MRHNPSPEQRGLTPLSRRGPTASRQARLQVVRIILPPGLAPRRRSRLTSNVMPLGEPRQLVPRTAHEHLFVKPLKPS